MAVAEEQEMIAQIEQNRAKVLEAEAEVPKAIAQAFNAGMLGLMDYYRLRNIQADTDMRSSIAKAGMSPPAGKRATQDECDERRRTDWQSVPHGQENEQYRMSAMVPLLAARPGGSNRGDRVSRHRRFGRAGTTAGKDKPAAAAGGKTRAATAGGRAGAAAAVRRCRPTWPTRSTSSCAVRPNSAAARGCVPLSRRSRRRPPSRSRRKSLWPRSRSAAR